MDLAQVLCRLPRQHSEQVLVGLETPDDAGVYLLDSGEALIQTLDFFTPVVDDPYDYGQIAAANSLSDIYAMGGRPLTAMNIVCFPLRRYPQEWLVEILRGGAAKIAESGAILLGGHTVEDETIKYGLSVTGLAPADQIVATAGARAGDRLVLTKALGTGLVTTAIKRGTAAADDVAAVLDSMKLLNAAAARGMVRVGVHACTDITGFGLAGHLSEMLRYSGVGAEIDWQALPVLPGAMLLAEQGVNTGGGQATRAYLGDALTFAADLPPTAETLLCDPQTSGGLLMAVAPEKLDSLLLALREEGVTVRSVIGVVTPGEAGGMLVR